jgi:hypothetical protein
MFEPGPSRVTKPVFRPAASPRASPSLVLINVSPIEYGHVLLVPRALDCLPQLVTPDTMLLALQLAREAGKQGASRRGSGWFLAGAWRRRTWGGVGDTPDYSCHAIA